MLSHPDYKPRTRFLAGAKVCCFCCCCCVPRFFHRPPISDSNHGCHQVTTNTLTCGCNWLCGCTGRLRGFCTPFCCRGFGAAVRSDGSPTRNNRTPRFVAGHLVKLAKNTRREHITGYRRNSCSPLGKSDSPVELLGLLRHRPSGRFKKFHLHETILRLFVSSRPRRRG